MSAQTDTASSGWKFLAVGPFVWGKGETREAAVREALKNSVPTYAKKPYQFTTYDIDPETGGTKAYVDDFGRIFGCLQKTARDFRVNGRRGKIQEVSGNLEIDRG